MNSTFRLGRILGVRVGVNWSVLVIAWLLAWSLASSTLPEQTPHRSDAAYWIVATFTALAFLGAFLAHELGHAFVARQNGVGVDDITIWMFGGVARLTGPARTAGAELRIALAGPAVSAVIGLAAVALAALGAALGADELVTAALLWLGVINVVLLVFNLIPAAPLDGGRVFSALLWKRWSDERRAHRAATRVGRWFGTCLIVLGVASFALNDPIGGVWLVFLGWFLTTAAVAEQSTADARVALEGVRAADVMTRDPIVAPRVARLDRFIDDVVHRSRHGAYPIVDDHGRVSGLVTLRAVRAMPRDGWSHCTVSEVATPIDRVATTTPDAAIVDVLEAMHGNGGDGRVLVFDNGRLVGIISPSDISRFMAERESV
jgi:Zn-dependent protease/predicted transcriptional regulator